MADKKTEEKVGYVKVYCSVILKNDMEYMVTTGAGWSDRLDECDFFVPATTLDGNPIVFNIDSVLIMREVSEKEFEAWQKSLADFREKKLNEAKAQEIVTNLKA